MSQFSFYTIVHSEPSDHQKTIHDFSKLFMIPIINNYNTELFNKLLYL